MLKTLLKKQMAEIFRNYFYDPKKNKMRSRGATIAYIALYVLLMAGVLGGMFALLAVGICGDECAAALRVRSQMAQGAFQCAALAPVLRAGQDLGIGQQRGKNIRIGRAAAVVRDDQPEVLPVQGLHQ